MGISSNDQIITLTHQVRLPSPLLLRPSPCLPAPGPPADAPPIPCQQGSSAEI